MTTEQELEDLLNEAGFDYKSLSRVASPSADFADAANLAADGLFLQEDDKVEKVRPPRDRRGRNDKRQRHGSASWALPRSVFSCF